MVHNKTGNKKSGLIVISSQSNIMKVGFDAKRAFLNSSGLGNYSRNTLIALQKYSPKNHYILFTPEIKEELFPNYKNFDVISPESSFSKIFKSLWRSFSVSGQLQKHEIDLFHGLSNELPEGIHKTEVPAVVTIHDLIFLRFPEFYKNIDRRIYFQKVKYACSSAQKIIAISTQTKEDIVKYFKMEPDKIEVVFQSVSPVYYEHQNTGYLVGKYELPENFILSVGSIEQRKNQLSLLKAIHDEKIEIPVVFVGKPTIYAETLLQFISDNKLEDRVKFLNNIEEIDLAGLFQRATLSVYISVFEGFGLPVIESMASGCPVITSNVSCLPETAGGAALLCNPGNYSELGKQIRLLIDNETLRNEFILKGSERAKQFHPKYFAEKMISLYAKLI